MRTFIMILFICSLFYTSCSTTDYIPKGTSHERVYIDLAVLAVPHDKDVNYIIVKNLGNRTLKSPIFVTGQFVASGETTLPKECYDIDISCPVPAAGEEKTIDLPDLVTIENKLKQPLVGWEVRINLGDYYEASTKEINYFQNNKVSWGDVSACF